MAGGRTTESIDAQTARLLAPCESPIERDFAIGLAVRWLTRTRGYFQFWAPGAMDLETIHGPEADAAAVLTLFPQAQIGDMRVDFVAAHQAAEGPSPMVFIECDGHDFHERTKEQARRDRQRDRRLQALGHPVLRFTGSELYADRYACADEVIDQLLKRAGA